MGGSDGQRRRLNSVERYDPAKNAWEAVAPMSPAREGPAAAVFDGKLYVMGGHDGRTRLSSVEQYDPARNEWVLGGNGQHGAEHRDIYPLCRIHVMMG